MSVPTFVTMGSWPEISPDGTKLAFSRFSETDTGADGTGTFQLFVSDVDGSNELCLSAAFLTTHVGMAHWHPSGDWIICTREMTVGYDGVHFNAHPGKGIFTNIWAVRPDGTDWTQLTTYASTRDGSPMHSPIGALQCRFNSAGDKLAWSSKIGTDTALPFAYWNLCVAEFTLPSDVPTLGTPDTYTPGSGTFYEVFQWNAAGTEILVATDAASVLVESCMWKQGTNALTYITGPDTEWDEWSFFSPDETRVAVMTSRNQLVQYVGAEFWNTLNTDIWTMDAAAYGSNWERLTYFNDPDHWMYFPRPEGTTVRVLASQWRPDGTLVFYVNTNVGSDQDHAGSQVWIWEGVTGAYTGKTVQAVFNPTADTFLLNATPTTNYGSNALLAIGDSTAAASAAYRSALKFDLSSIPATATVTGASLQLYEYSASDAASIGKWNAEAWRLLKDWTGSQATWNVRQTGVKWASAGALTLDQDTGEEPVDSTELDGVAAGDFVSWSGQGLVDLVQGWVDGTYANYGVLITAPDAENAGVAGTAANLFLSSDYSLTPYRPRLVVWYETAESREMGTSLIQDLLAAPKFGFKLRFESVDESGGATDITSRIYGPISIWYGERAASVYGWSIGLSGHNYDRVLLAARRKIKIYRQFTTVADAELLWFEGYIQPGEVSVDWNTQKWNLSVVDIVTYLSNRRAPIWTLGELNIATEAGTTVDSFTTPEAIADEGEFIGYPSLDGDRAVDGDMGSLWVSGKAPALETIPLDNTVNDIVVAEVYNPGFGLNKQEYQWIELSTRGTYTGTGVRLMTRYGILDLPELEFGEPFGPGTTNDTKARYAILAFDASKFSSLFGNVTHAPVYEWKNQLQDFEGFNLDGLGDYIALGGASYDGAPPETGSNHWTTMYVEDGSAMGAIYDDGAVSTSPPAPREYIEVTFPTASWAANELTGWFVQTDYNTAGGIPLYNRQRRIVSNTATSATVTRIYVQGGWTLYPAPYDYVPVVGHEVRITPFPFANSSLGIETWPKNDRVSPPGAGNSNRHVTHLRWWAEGNWVLDDTPQPGWSSVTPDSTLWSWIDVQPDEMTFSLSSPLNDDETDVYLSGTDGLLPVGYVYIGVLGPFAYSDKTTEKITLVDPWYDGFVPQGTTVFQSMSGAAERRWPVSKVRVKRRPIYVDGSEGEIRSIDSLRVFASNLDTPRYPDEENWREDWINNGNAIWGAGPGNKFPIITFNLPTGGASYLGEDGYLRVRHYLFAIRAMSDESNGRINEIDILPPPAVVSGSVTNLTVAGFFKSILTVMGVAENNIQYGDGSTELIGSLSTDNSSYTAVLSDLAVRTGQVVWPGPNGGKVRISYNPNWPTSVALEPYAWLDKSNIRTARLRQRDDGSISQVLVTTRDAEGNVGYGEFPPLPRNTGEIYVEPKIFHAPAEKAQDIARWLYWSMISDMVEPTTVGPAPWARPGEYRIEFDWYSPTGVDLIGSYVIRSLQHSISFGDGTEPRSWVSTLELARLINTG